MDDFTKFRISNEIIDALTILGYDEPTRIQERVIDRKSVV